MHEEPNVSRRGFLARTSALGIAGLVGAAAPMRDGREGTASAGLDLARVSCAQFAACVGSTFRICPVGGSPVEVELVRAGETRRACAARGEVRNPFTLLFRGEHGQRLGQDTYQIEHERLGEFCLFVVPVGCGTEPVYEAIFA